MQKIKQILAVATLLLCSLMVFFTWRTPENTAWLVALVGWLEISFNQRKKEMTNDHS
jgi:Na+/pantothenate symporter